jgi:hypothetical protein
MKGLLHRLAARAFGEAALVRSDVRLPFSGAAFGRGAVAGDEAILEQPSTINVRARTSNASTATAQQRARSQSNAPEPTIDLLRESPQAPQGDASPAVAPDRGSDVHAVLSAAAPPTEGEGDSSQPPRLVGGAPRGAGDTIVFHSEAPAKPVFRSGAPQSETPRYDGELSLLMPLAASSLHAPVSRGGAPTATRHAAGPNSIVCAGTTEERTDVHIHIGRIEVTAVHEAAPPRRRPTPTASLMSLDAYLAKRGRA